MSDPFVLTQKGVDHFKSRCKWYRYMEAALDFYLYEMWQSAMATQFYALAEREEWANSIPLDGNDWLTYNELYALGEPQ